MKKLERNVIRKGDCLKLFETLSAKAVDHTIMDPPYEEECHDGKKRVRGNPGMKGSPSTRVKTDFDRMNEAERTKVASEVVRVTKGWALVFCQIEATHLWRDAFMAAGASYRRTCMVEYTELWHKPNAMPKIIPDGPSQAYEAFLAVWCGTDRSIWNGGGMPGWHAYHYNTVKHVHHETEKPEGLLVEMILNYTQPGQVVLDCYAGGGTTGAAAKVAHRDYILWEKQASHVATMRARLKKTKQRSLQSLSLQFPKIRNAAFGKVFKKKSAGLLPGFTR